MARQKKDSTTTGKRRWSEITVPPAWIKPGARALWYFVMSYYDGEPCTIIGTPYQLGHGGWLVEIKLDADGRTIRAALEALDELSPTLHKPAPGAGAAGAP